MGLIVTAPWTTEPIAANYRGHTYWLLPETKGTPPAVATLQGQTSYEEGRWRLMRFLSALAWSMKCGIGTEGVAASGYLRVMGASLVAKHASCQWTEVPKLPEPTTTEAATALALMREARSNLHPAFRFLSYYRVVESATTSANRNSWLEAKIALILKQRGTLTDLSARFEGCSAQTVRDHIQSKRRHAIAHAKVMEGERVIDPDDCDSRDAITEELDLLDMLAERAVEKRHGVKSTATLCCEDQGR